VKLPQALEKILAFKDVRAQEVGVSPEELEEMNKPKSIITYLSSSSLMGHKASTFNCDISVALW
jgi:hypothetical protein